MGKGFIFLLDESGKPAGANIDVFKNSYTGFVEFELINDKTTTIKTDDVFYYSDNDLESSCGTYKATLVFKNKISATRVK